MTTREIYFPEYSIFCNNGIIPCEYPGTVFSLSNGRRVSEETHLAGRDNRTGSRGQELLWIFSDDRETGPYPVTEFLFFAVQIKEAEPEQFRTDQKKEEFLVAVIIAKLAEEIIYTQAIVVAVIMTVIFIFVIIVLFVVVIVRLPAFLVDLDVAAFQGARSAVSVRECQAEAVPAVVTAPAFVDNNDRVCVGSPAIDFGSTFDLPCHGIDDRVCRNSLAIDIDTIVIIV